METILIADDHEIIRLGVKKIIETFPGNYEFLEASNCTDVVHLFKSRKVHYAVLDLFLENGNLFSPLEQFVSPKSSTAILIFSTNAEKVYARRLLLKGVRGIVSKHAGVNELENALQILLKGGMYLSPALKDSLLNAKDAGNDPLDLLSDRELEVVEYASKGMGTKEIAVKMNLDISTISTYRRRAFEKLDVQNIIELKENYLVHRIQK